MAKGPALKIEMQSGSPQPTYEFAALCSSVCPADAGRSERCHFVVKTHRRFNDRHCQYCTCSFPQSHIQRKNGSQPNVFEQNFVSWFLGLMSREKISAHLRFDCECDCRC